MNAEKTFAVCQQVAVKFASVVLTKGSSYRAKVRQHKPFPHCMSLQSWLCSSGWCPLRTPSVMPFGTVRPLSESKESQSQLCCTW